jgi:integrase
VGLSAKTIHNVLSTFRRVLHLAERDGKITKNPASRIGELMRRVDRRAAQERKEVQFWSPAEVQKLLEIARQHEPLLVVLFSTGMRRGEALGLPWTDIDFEHHTLTIRRALTSGQLGTPKSGRSRTMGARGDVVLQWHAGRDSRASKARQALRRRRRLREPPTLRFEDRSKGKK